MKKTTKLKKESGELYYNELFWIGLQYVPFDFQQQPQKYLSAV